MNADGGRPFVNDCPIKFLCLICDVVLPISALHIPKRHGIIAASFLGSNVHEWFCNSGKWHYHSDHACHIFRMVQVCFHLQLNPTEDKIGGIR